VSAPASLPPILEPGDHLTRGEFHRRYCARPDIKKAELVEGVVYVPSPVRLGLHSEPHVRITIWLGTYWIRHPGLRMGDNATVYLDERTEVQPDAFLCREEPGGPVVSAEDYVEGAPQLIVEVAASSASYDVHDKLEAYRRNGVREYVVWRVLDGAIDWLRLQDGSYVQVMPDAQGVIESETFTGLRLHILKMLAGDVAGVLAELDPPPAG
jgi:Uma2 family endonuclease